MLPWKNNEKLIETLYTKIQDLEKEVTELKKEVNQNLALKKLSSNIVETVIRRLKEEFSSKENTTPVS